MSIPRKRAETHETCGHRRGEVIELFRGFIPVATEITNSRPCLRGCVCITRNHYPIACSPMFMTPIISTLSDGTPESFRTTATVMPKIDLEVGIYVVL
jgi:hypothetical protein